MRNPAAFFASAMLTAVIAQPASGQHRFQVVGPDQCLNCHSHDPEHEWYSRKEILEVQRLFPEKGANAGHTNSLRQLDAAKSNDFAKAIGLADKWDVSGACVRCHATVFSGDANAGVSCESCHGPASGYLVPHQVQGAYEQSVAQYGMTRLVGNVQGWTQQCTNCHVMDDDRLIKAGHPAGDDFDLSKKYLPVSAHFKKAYAAAAIDAIAKGEMEGIMRRRRPGAAAPPLVADPVSAMPPAPPPPASPPAVGTPPVGAVQPPPSPPAVTKPGPRAPAAPVPARAKVLQPDLSAPTPGSPTSIEPPPPASAAAASAAAPPPAPAATSVVTTPAEDSSGLLRNPWLWGAGVVVLVAVGGLVWSRRKKT